MAGDRKFNKALITLAKAERAAQKAQQARDAAQRRWEAAMNVLRPEGEPYSPSWLAHCEFVGADRGYSFGDILC